MSTLVRDVCRLYPETFVGHDTIQTDPVPPGWRALVLALLGDLVEVLGPTPPQRLVLMRVDVRDGLRVAHGLRPIPDEGAAVEVVVGAVVGSAERRCRGICDRCGGPGDEREAPDGTRSFRCEMHALVGRSIPAARPDGGRADPEGSVLAYFSGRDVGFTRSACAAFSDALSNMTQEEEVPPGWRRLCADLLSEVALMMAGAQGRRLELRRLHPERDALHWVAVLPPSTPDVVRRGIGIAFRRAAEEAYWTCQACGRRDGGLLCEDLDVCSCGAIWSRPAKRPPVPLVTLPLLPPDVPGAARRRFARRLLRPPASAPRSSGAGPRIPVYRRTDVAASLGLATAGEEGPDLLIHGEAGDSEQHVRLDALLKRGDEGRWRRLATPHPDAIAAVAALGRVAPHLDVVIDHVVRHLRASASIGLPITMPPTLLLGPPGVGKTWLLTRLAGLLTLPHRLLPMNLTATGDGISGAHPVWRNSGPGLVAKLLLAEEVANPLVVVDEFDKARLHNGVDPYASFYTLLEPVGAAAFVDEYFGMPFNASRIIWVMSANDLSPIPEPILDRLTIIDVHAPGPEHLAAVIDSIYADANASRKGYFVSRLDPALLRRLADQPPRSIRVMIEDAMVRAAAVGRRSIVESDLVERRTGTGRRPIGFFRPSGRAT